MDKYGYNSTQAKHAVACGATALASVPPYYVPLDYFGLSPSVFPLPPPYFSLPLFISFFLFCPIYS